MGKVINESTPLKLPIFYQQGRKLLVCAEFTIIRIHGTWYVIVHAKYQDLQMYHLHVCKDHWVCNVGLYTVHGLWSVVIKFWNWLCVHLVKELVCRQER